MSPKEDLKKIGAKLKQARTDLNLSVRDVEEESGLHRNTIWRIEAGRLSTSLLTIITLLRVYELPFSYLDE